MNKGKGLHSLLYDSIAKELFPLCSDRLLGAWPMAGTPWLPGVGSRALWLLSWVTWLETHLPGSKCPNLILPLAYTRCPQTSFFPCQPSASSPINPQNLEALGGLSWYP